MNQSTIAAIARKGRAYLIRLQNRAPITSATNRHLVNTAQAAGRVFVGKQSQSAPSTNPMRIAAAAQTQSFP